MKTHQLKVWPEFFQAIDRGEKTFEVRKGNDRVYRPGDLVALREWNPEARDYTGSFVTMAVTYVMHGGPWLPDDVWVFGIRPITAEDMIRRDEAARATDERTGANGS